jgi:hypothetical protein
MLIGQEENTCAKAQTDGRRDTQGNAVLEQPNQSEVLHSGGQLNTRQSWPAVGTGERPRDGGAATLALGRPGLRM